MRTPSTTDRIEKKVVLRAPRSRVWKAITDTREFSQWFGATMETPFAPGARSAGRINYEGYQHLTMEVWVERIEPEHYFSYRWHPNAVAPDVDYSKEPTTLVEFKLAEVEGGTEVTIIESGFDQLPAARRDEALKSNRGGWAEQLENIGRHVGP